MALLGTHLDKTGLALGCQGLIEIHLTDWDSSRKDCISLGPRSIPGPTWIAARQDQISLGLTEQLLGCF